MPTNFSLLGTHGIDLDVARKYGDRLENFTLFEKSALIEGIGGWMASCASNLEEDWGSLDEYLRDFACTTDRTNEMCAAYFDYCDPDHALGLLLALVYQVKEEVYAPDDAMDFEDDELDLDEIFGEGEAA